MNSSRTPLQYKRMTRKINKYLMGIILEEEKEEEEEEEASVTNCSLISDEQRLRKSIALIKGVRGKRKWKMGGRWNGELEAELETDPDSEIAKGNNRKEGKERGRRINGIPMQVL